MRDLLRGLSSGQLPRRALALTFDDGYRDNLTHAVPLLQEYRVPATIFLITGFPGQEFWWDQLARLLQTPRGLRRAVRITKGHYLTDIVDEDLLRSYLHDFLYDRLMWKTGQQREVVFKALSMGTTDSAMADPEAPRALTIEEIRELFRQPGIEIGGHTMNHPRLKYLPPEVQRREIAHSRQYLEELSGQKIAGFSYPHGSFSHQTEQIVQEAGYEYACSSVENVCYPGGDRYALPRFWVPDIPGPAFARWLRRWLR